MLTTRLTQRSYFELRPQAIVTASVLPTAVIVAVASVGNVCMGDEITHVNHARAYKETGHRVPFHPMFFDGHGRRLPLTATPLWHAGPAAVWALPFLWHGNLLLCGIFMGADDGFVEKVRSLPYFENAFEDKDFVIFRVAPMPPPARSAPSGKRAD